MRHTRRALRAGLGAALASLLPTIAAPTAAQATLPGADGRIAFTANLHGSWQIYTMRPNGTAIRQVTHIPGSRDLAMTPSRSPDGRTLAFTSSRSGNLDGYTINVDGTGMRRITRSPGNDFDVTWSPDGKHFAFSHSDNFQTAAIWTMNTDGTHQVRLTNPSHDSFLPIYTPNGRNIVFTSTKGALVSAAWIMNVDGSHQRQLTPAPFQGFAWDVSPDGKHLLLGNNGSSNKPTSLFEMNFDGTGLRRLTNAGCCVHDSNARYSPDGTTIAFTTNRSFASRGLPLTDEIWEMTTTGANMHPVTSSLTLGGCPDDLVDNCVGPLDWSRRP